MRRFLRFRLRTLLIAVTALSIYLGWHVHSAETQRNALDGIHNLGGWAYYDFQIVNDQFDPKSKSWVPEWLRRKLGNDFFHDVVHVNMVYNDDGPHRLENNQTSDAALSIIGRLPNVRLVGLSGGQATDSGLHELSKVKQLRRLLMWDAAQVTDEGIKQLRNLPHLKYVHCSNAQLTDESLRTFATMKQLDGLSLQGNHFTDRGVAYLTGLRKLKELWIGLGPTQITDAGLKHLEKLSALKVLDVQQASITLDGLTHLVEARPNLTVYHGLTEKLPARASVATKVGN